VELAKVQRMNTELRIGQQLITFDPEATVALYANPLTVAGANECSCTSCKNFAAQRTSVYPAEFLSLLSQLGADPLKELEAFDYGSGPENPKRRLYGGWFAFSGEVREGATWRPEHRQGTFTYWFTTNFPGGGLPQESKFCAVEFIAELPWIISEPPD
jgi:hypothetical protein